MRFWRLCVSVLALLLFAENSQCRAQTQIVEGVCFSSGSNCEQSVGTLTSLPRFFNNSFFGVHIPFDAKVQVIGANVTITPAVIFGPDGVIIPGIPADQCQNMIDNAFLPFVFDFSGNAPGSYAITLQVVKCDGTVIASGAHTLVVFPPVTQPPPPQLFQLSLGKDEGSLQVKPHGLWLKGTANAKRSKFPQVRMLDQI